MVAAIIGAATLSACTTTTAYVDPSLSTAPTPPTSKSTIVSQMTNYYKENPELAIDPCHDSFIASMQTLAFDLTSDVVFPKGRSMYGYWFASCNYSAGNLNALVESATAPIMAESEAFQQTDNPAEWSYFIEINGRRTVVRPPIAGQPGCMVSMTTSFGSMTITGGDLRDPDPVRDCDRIVELLRQIEPWIDD